MQTFDEFLQNSPVTSKVEATNGLPSFDDYLKTAPPVAPKPTLVSKIVGGVKDYAQKSADLVPSLGEKILHPWDSLQKLPDVFMKPLLAGEKQAGDALYGIVSNLKPSDAFSPIGIINLANPQTVAHTSNLVSGLIKSALAPISGLNTIAENTPGLKQVADTINLPLNKIGELLSGGTGKIIDWIPDKILSSQSKDILREPLKEAVATVGTIYLAGHIMDKVADYTGKGKVITPEEARNIVVKAQEETNRIPIQTAKTRYEDYRKSQGYEPYTPDGQLPTIEMGSKSKETLPTIQTETPQSNKIGSLRYDPIKNPTPPTFEQFQSDIQSTQPTLSEKIQGKPVIKSAEVRPFEAPEVKTTKLSSDLADELAKSGITPNKAEMATYKTEENFMKHQADRALKLITENPEQAKRVAMGEEDAPTGLKNESVFKALGKIAREKGDIQTILDLSRSKVATEASIKGQDIKSLDVGDHVNDPVKILQDVKKAREVKVEETTKKTVVKAKKAVVDEISSEINKLKPTKQTWSELVDQIKCNY